MASLKLFAVHDAKANAFLAPFALPATGLAIRSFTDAANNPETPISKYPNDFRLAHIGTFDDNNGQLHPEPITWLGYATDFIRRDDAPIPLRGNAS